MRPIIILPILAALAFAIFACGVAGGFLFGLPARKKLRQHISDAGRKLSELAATADGLRGQVNGLTFIASHLSNANVELLRRLSIQQYFEHSQPEAPQTQPPLADLAAQTPIYSGTPGTTTCLTCGVVVATPENSIPGQWLLNHTGHTINIQLNQERYAADDAFPNADGDVIM